MTAMRRTPSPFVMAAVVSVLGVIAFALAGAHVRLWLLVVAPLAAAVTVILSVGLRGPARPRAWLLLALALVSAAIGSAVQVHEQAITSAVSLAFDVGSLAVGVAILAFTPPVPAERDRFAWLESAIGLVSLATVGYQFLVQPYVDAGATTAAVTSAAALPTLDLGLFALLLRLRDHRPRRSTSLAVLVGALCCAVASDTVVGLATIGGQYHPGSRWDGFSYVSYLALGVAAVHPSMTKVGLPSAGVAPSRVPGLLLLLPAGAVVPALCLGAVLGRLHLDLWLAAAAGLVLFLLAMSRAIDLLARSERASLHDALTGLANLRRFRNELARSAHLPHGVTALLALLDLDDFKAINDTYGHTVGDALLVQVADRLTAALPAGLLVARFGGDEFGVLAVGTGADATTQADRIGSQILSVFAEPFVLEGLPLRVSASVGVVISPDVQTLERLQVDADIAMYAAKDAGRATYRVYSRELRDQMLGQRELAGQLDHALRHPGSGGLWVAYQPVVAVDGAGLRSVEALVRWRHPSRGPLLPGQFLPAAEHAGLSAELDELVLATALRQLATWCDADPAFRSIRVAVNMTAASLSRSDLVAHVLDQVANAGLLPSQLTIEITEQTAVPGGPELTAALKELTAAGVELAIDDFGTGYSALNYLERFPVSVLKLDSSLINSVDTQPSPLLAAVTALARSLGLVLVAEGVERAGQLVALQQLDIPYVQGFLFARAQPARAVEDYLRSHSLHTGVRVTASSGPPAGRSVGVPSPGRPTP